MSQTHYRCLSFHAESLQNDSVWHEVVEILTRLRRRGARATLFVHPLGAIQEGKDLTGRLKWLEEHGHEVGQHTHYYGKYEQTVHGLQKETALTSDNIRRCLDRDYEYLARAGVFPRGYVSGAWAIHETVFDWLVERDFLYDCSFRSYRLSYENPDAKLGDCHQAPFRRNGLLEIPTTAPLSEMLLKRALRRTTGLTVGDIRYDVYYLHDYDLLSRTKRSAVLTVEGFLSGSGGGVTVGELAEVIQNRLRG